MYLVKNQLYCSSRDTNQNPFRMSNVKSKEKIHGDWSPANRSGSIRSSIRSFIMGDDDVIVTLLWQFELSPLLYRCFLYFTPILIRNTSFLPCKTHIFISKLNTPSSHQRSHVPHPPLPAIQPLLLHIKPLPSQRGFFLSSRSSSTSTSITTTNTIFVQGRLKRRQRLRRSPHIRPG